jgi:hypothetical protein
MKEEEDVRLNEAAVAYGGPGPVSPGAAADRGTHLMAQADGGQDSHAPARTSAARGRPGG